jgi:RimJ/RimL family protein N-acetyltransferase
VSSSEHSTGRSHAITSNADRHGPDVDQFAGAAAIVTERLVLSPLTIEDADAMVVVLGDQRLHEFIGGRPSGVDELRDRYARMIAGSSRPDEVWLNWIVRRRGDEHPIGTMQATLTSDAGRWTAHVAWIIGVAWQRNGFGSAAAAALVAWLRHDGVDSVVAHIHPQHDASEIVARRSGLHQSDEVVDGERVWRSRDDG